LDTSLDVSATNSILASSTDAVLSAAAAAVAASRYNYLTNEVAHAFPGLNPATAAVAAAAAAAMASVKQPQPQQHQSSPAASMATTINPLGLHTAIPLAMADPITECPSQQLSKPILASQFAEKQFQDQLHATASMAMPCAETTAASFVSIEKIPTEQAAEADDAGVETARRSTRADSLFEKS
ncbi:hypothetical protein GGF39_002363, partial [Coemansia sp. RSA 1721]